jgi:hypothetical protein
VVAGVTIVTQFISALAPALLTTLVLSTAKLVASVGSNGTKNTHGKDQKETKTYFFGVWKKYTKFPAFSRNIVLTSGQCFLEANCNLWKVLNWILWHFHPNLYKKYSAVPKFSE